VNSDREIFVPCESDIRETLSVAQGLFLDIVVLAVDCEAKDNLTCV
jgi:hypothetical protein